jgi:hypothetical protein
MGGGFIPAIRPEVLGQGNLATEGCQLPCGGSRTPIGPMTLVNAIRGLSMIESTHIFFFVTASWFRQCLCLLRATGHVVAAESAPRL